MRPLGLMLIAVLLLLPVIWLPGIAQGRDVLALFSQYLGMVALQLGVALTFAVEWALIGAVVVWSILHWGVVLREEAYLTAKFGAPYEAYLRRTRRWL